MSHVNGYLDPNRDLDHYPDILLCVNGVYVI